MNMMIDVAMEINMQARMGKVLKKLGYKAISSIIEFQQLFIQGLWVDSDPMLQLPGPRADQSRSYSGSAWDKVWKRQGFHPRVQLVQA